MTDYTYHVAPDDQGQTVEYAYAATHTGYVIRRIHDRSVGTIEYAMSRMLSDDDAAYWQAPPKNLRWRSISATAAKEV